MKILLFQAAEFAFSDDHETLAPARGPARIVALIHAEPNDRADQARVVRKAVKQIKWLAGKRGLEHVVLHSFAHLSPNKAPVAEAGALIDALANRLEGAGYRVTTTPFGESLAWRLTVFQEPLAKVFISID